jgi:superoxide reductase
MSDTSPIAYTRVADFEGADDFTKKHTPYITSQRDGDTVVITVEVGHEVAHPNTLDHFIMYIEVYASMVPIARFQFTPTVTWPKVSFSATLPPDTQVMAIEHCNLHGVWVYEKVV